MERWHLDGQSLDAGGTNVFVLVSKALSRPHSPSIVELVFRCRKNIGIQTYLLRVCVQFELSHFSLNQPPFIPFKAWKISSRDELSRHNGKEGARSPVFPRSYFLPSDLQQGTQRTADQEREAQVLPKQ